MKRRWPLVLAYSVTVVIEVALLVGTRVLHSLSQEHMMLMRYLYAKNLELESSLFSASSLHAQTLALGAIAVAAVAVAVIARRRSRFVRVQLALVAAVAGGAAWMGTTQSTADVYVLYVAIAAAWVVLLMQAVVVLVAWRRHAQL